MQIFNKEYLWAERQKCNGSFFISELIRFPTKLFNKKLEMDWVELYASNVTQEPLSYTAPGFEPTISIS